MDAARQLLRRAGEVAADPAGDVPSPCVSVCRMDPRTQLCEGCFRTLDEIAAWSRLGNNEKRGVWRSIARRALNDAVIPAEVTRSVVPAQAGTQGSCLCSLVVNALDPRLRGDDEEK